jgi:hypothetical protein
MAGPQFSLTGGGRTARATAASIRAGSGNGDRYLIHQKKIAIAPMMDWTGEVKESLKVQGFGGLG